MGAAIDLEILPPPQRALWLELAQLPQDAVLYGGTALALRLAHRQSVDFDLFFRRPLDIAALQRGIPFLNGARVLQRAPNTLTVLVDRNGPVQVSFFGVPALPQLIPAERCADNQLQIASLLDLAGTKASVVQLRAEAKDYLDIDALIERGGIGLPLALAAAQALYGMDFNPQSTLKALSYFDDGNLGELPAAVRERLVSAARAVDLDRLPAIRG